MASIVLPPMSVVLPASAIGLFSIGVLNVNNIRDMATDAGTRNTIPLRIGERRAKIYHTFLIVGGWLLLIVYTLIVTPLTHWASYLYMVTLPLYVVHLRGVWHSSGRALDPMLPMLVISTFALAILLGVGQLISNA